MRRLTEKIGVCVLLSSFVLLSNSYARHSYRIDASIDYKRQEVRGKVSIDVRNDSNVSLDSVYLALYPNWHAQKSAFLNDVNYGWIYPDNFDPSGMEIESVSSQGQALEHYFNEGSGPASTFTKVLLKKELMPKETSTIDISYLVKIPKKFGPFGHYRKDVILNGGFYPYVPFLTEGGEWKLDAYPDNADYGIVMNGSGEFLLNGELMKGENGKYEAYLKDVDYLSLFNTKKIIEEEIKGDNVKVKVIYHSREGSLSRALRKTVLRFIDFVERQEEFKGQERQIVLCEAYLRDRLVQPSDGVVYFSDRAFKLFPPLRNYNAIQVVRGLFYGLLRPIVREKESALTYDWVTNTVALYYTEAFIRDFYAQMKRDARNLKLVRIFSFLPQLDQVIYAPQFSFENAYYDQIYAYDLFRLDILDFNNETRSKRVIYEKLKDMYSDSNDLAGFYKVYVLGGDPFREKAKALLGEGAEKTIDSWLGRYPKVNFYISDIKRAKQGKRHENTVTVGREGDIEEPVTVHLEEWGGKDHFLKWDGIGDKKELSIETDERLRTVQIDPFGRLLESRLADNRSPALYKWILTSYNVGVDLNSLSPTIGLSTQFRKIYGSYSRYNLAGYRDVATYGGSFGYSRLFGRLVDSLRLSHGFAVYYKLDGLGNDYVLTKLELDDPSQGFENIIINESGMSTAIFVYYYFGNMLSYTNPKEGMNATFYAGLASRYLGGDYGYFKLGMNWTGIIPFDQNHLLAVKCELGFSGNDGIPVQQQYYLGGIYGMRGFPSGQINRIGRHKILYSVEYRHYLLKDIDINIFSLFRVRNIMGAFFFDAGRVVGTVEEYGRRLAYGEPFDANPLNLFNLKRYDADFGYGIKFLHDLLGVKEAVLSFDLAKSITDYRDIGLRYYISFAHSF